MRQRVLALALALGAIVAAPVAAERHFQLTGRVASTFAFEIADGGGLRERDLLFELESRCEWKSGWELRALGRARFEDRLEPEAYREAELRELVVSRTTPSSTLKLGRQQVVWGRADGLRLLDVVNPLDLREYILDDFNDSRIPLWMVNAELFRGDQSFQLLLIPDLTFDRLAAPGGDFFLAPALPELPVPITVGEVEKPSSRPENWEYGFKWSALLGRLDFSVNALWGWNDAPVPTRHLSAAGLEVVPRILRSRIVGFSGDLPLGPTVLRFEATFTPDDPREIATPDGLGRFASQQVWRHVVGLDWLKNNWLLSPQWFEERVINPDPRLAGDRRLSFFTFLVRRTFRQDRLLVQLFFAYGFDHRDLWISPRLSYRFFGQLELALGADLLGGDPVGSFGRFADRDRITFETSVRF